MLVDVRYSPGQIPRAKMKSYGFALEWLEEGRSIVWKQMLQLRTPFDDVSAVHPALAEELKQVARSLESVGFFRIPKESASASDTTTEETSQKHRRLTEKWNKLVEQVRKLPGFDAFLRPRRVSELTAAAESGPVVVINVQKTSCDALVIQPGSTDITHIPLKFSYDKATRARVRMAHVARSRSVIERGVHSGAGKSKDDLGRTLVMLWGDVVEPVLNFLGYMQPSTMSELPHITWCPTGPLSFLPLHAAGDYTAERMVFNYVVSSYTPTLSALLSAPSSASFSGILTVSQEATLGEAPLPGTVAELSKIQETFKGLVVNRLDRELATPDAVLTAMEEHSWVHLACHATQNTTDPTQSAFSLHGGMLDLASITRKPLKHAELAFLSACQTATGDEILSEEAVHLAAGMLMAGYRTVIATMWSISDEDGPVVAEKVYEHLMEGGGPDARRAAVAVHKATEHLRNKLGMKAFARWVPYIHIGL